MRDLKLQVFEKIISNNFFGYGENQKNQLCKMNAARIDIAIVDASKVEENKILLCT